MDLVFEIERLTFLVYGGSIRDSSCETASKHFFMFGSQRKYDKANSVLMKYLFDSDLYIFVFEVISIWLF